MLKTAPARSTSPTFIIVILPRSFCKKSVELLRSSDVLGRYGGEEFIAILPEIAHPQAEAIADRLRQYIAETAVTVDGHRDIRFTVSIGVAAYPESGKDAENLVRIADKLLYKAKESGRNCVIAEYDAAPTPISILRKRRAAPEYEPAS